MGDRRPPLTLWTPASPSGGARGLGARRLGAGLIAFALSACAGPSAPGATPDAAQPLAAPAEVQLADGATGQVAGASLRVSDLGWVTEANGDRRVHAWLHEGPRSYEVFEGDVVELNGEVYLVHLDPAARRLHLRRAP